MRFSIAVMVAAVGALLLTGGIAVASTVDDTPAPRPVGFSTVAEAAPTTADPVPDPVRDPVADPVRDPEADSTAAPEAAVRASGGSVEGR